MKRVKLLDTGQRNEGFALRVSYPEKDYNSRPIKERKRQYNKEYYRRPEVIARRKTPAKLAEKAAYDKLYTKRPGYKERKRESRRRLRKRRKKAISLLKK